MQVTDRETDSHVILPFWGTIFSEYIRFHKIFDHFIQIQLIDYLGTSLKPRYPKHEGEQPGNTGRLRYDTSHTYQRKKEQKFEMKNESGRDLKFS